MAALLAEKMYGNYNSSLSKPIFVCAFRYMYTQVRPSGEFFQIPSLSALGSL
jgi:hypothetical protein